MSTVAPVGDVTTFPACGRDCANDSWSFPSGRPTPRSPGKPPPPPGWRSRARVVLDRRSAITLYESHAAKSANSAERDRPWSNRVPAYRRLALDRAHGPETDKGKSGRCRTA
jgi:hypothetical protein